MANATVKVPITTTPWGDDKINRGLYSTAQIYYPGAMIARRSADGYAVKCDDSTGIVFDGINVESDRIQVFTGESAGDRNVPVGRPWRFTMAIAAAAAGDEGKALYAVDDQTVGYSSSNSVLIGWVDKVLSTTLVLVNPLYAPLNPVQITNNILAFTGLTGVDAITMPDNLADALHLSEGSNIYTKYTTTNGSEVALYGSTAATGVTNAGGAIQVIAGVGGATSGVGGLVTITAGAAGAGSSAGGTVIIAGGAGGGTAGAGGLVSLTGGAATAGNAAGGAASLIGGAGQGSSAGGAITITSGAAGATGVAGAINIAVGSAAAGAGSAVTISGGTGLGSTNAGGHVNMIPGAAASTGAPGEFQVNSVAGTMSALYAQGPGTVPTTATSYTFFIADRAYRVKAVRCVASTAGGSGCTVDVIKDTGSAAAPGSGTSVLGAPASLAGTAGTVVAPALAALVATKTLAAGDRLSTTWAGTISPLAGATVSVLLVPC